MRDDCCGGVEPANPAVSTMTIKPVAQLHSMTSRVSIVFLSFIDWPEVPLRPGR